VRALLVHEFAHWFYIATRVVNGSDSGEKDGGILDVRNEGLTESDTQIDAQDWFGKRMRGVHPARRFDDALDFEQAAGLEEYFYVVSPRLGDTVGGIDISDDVRLIFEA